MPPIHITYQQKGYLSKSKHNYLEEAMKECSLLYNAALQERKEAYKICKRSINYIDQYKSLTQIRADIPEWKALDVQIGRGVLTRIDRAFKSFFRRVKRGEKPGYPRFKSASRFRTIEITQPHPGMLKVNSDKNKAYIRIKGLPTIEMRLKRKLPSPQQLKSLRITIRPTGIVIDMGFKVERSISLPLTGKNNNVGIDFGINNRLTLSDGTFVERRLVDRARETKLRQDVSRSKRGSNRRRKRVRMLSREMYRNQVKNRNTVHRLTTDIVRKYNGIAVEKLNIKNMTRSTKGTVEEPGKNVKMKSGLNREILTQTWGLIREQLRYKAEWAGNKEFVEVDPKYTSQICSSCGNREKQEEYRIYTCKICGMKKDRDFNAAVNILQRAFEPKSTGAGIFSPESQLKEVRTIA